MSQNYKLKFDKMRESNPAGAEENNAQGMETPDEQYPSGSNVRNLCFSWPDGKRFFLNYTYLISGEFLPSEDKIDLLFSTHNVVLKGINLEPLFNALIHHIPKIISCIDNRYAATEDTDRSAVNEIIATSLND